MIASRVARSKADAAGAEIIAALILFGIFVTTIAFLNLTSVPAAGTSAEEEHWNDVLAKLNDLQTSAEGASVPGKEGAQVSTGLDLGPPQRLGQDFFSFFLATPARASGQVTFQSLYGNVSVSHNRTGGPVLYDVGSATERFPYGRIHFDPHPNFREASTARMENGGIVTTTASSETMRFAPPVGVTVSGGTTYVTLKVRVLNGTPYDMGGIAPVRLSLLTEAATLTSPAADNARNATLRLETDHGSAWGAYLNETALDGGLTSGQFTTVVLSGAGAGGLDLVIWTVEGTTTANTNDVRLTTGLSVLRATAG